MTLSLLTISGFHKVTIGKRLYSKISQWHVNPKFHYCNSSTIQNKCTMENILKFAFPVDENGNESNEKYLKLWYANSLQIDQNIRERFASDWQKAVTGQYADWEQTPNGCLALVVLMDQMARNMFRNNSGSFSSDSKALRVSKVAIEKSFDLQLTRLGRGLLYMPLMHSENSEDHKLSEVKFDQLALEDPASFEASAKYERMHGDIIRRFGRYPHRNNILGRVSTPEEEEFLKQPGSSF